MDKRRMPGTLPEAPESFTDAIFQGSLRIREYERRRARARRALLFAACLVVAVGLAAAALLRPAAVEDNVTLAAPEATPREVWVHPDDAHFHRSRECARCPEDAVRMQTDTAMEFGKEACPECFGGS